MKAVTKLTFLNHEGEKFFGEGPARLLRSIEDTGSLRASAMSMNMAYSKALRILKKAEDALGFPLTTRCAGGRSGGGSTLTAEGRAWLARYEACRDACAAANQAIVRQFFPKVGCVIMASGLGKRFGGNKLMADFAGKPLFLRALEASEGLKDHRVVVTRHADVAEICRDLGVNVILHQLPNRNDTVRLGLEALGDLDGCLFLPADQPLLRRETVDGLVKAWENDRESILRPIHEDTPGAPVLFPAWAFPALRTLPEGKGGGWIIRNQSDRVKLLEVEDEFELMDADTPELLAVLERRFHDSQT